MNISRRIARIHTAARHTAKALRYRCLSGLIAVAVDAGTLIRVSTYLTGLGLDDEFIDRYGSPFGKHVVKAHRADGRGEPVRVWICNARGRYVHVFAYRPGDQALHAAVASYARTRHLVQSDLAEAA
ncbi:hypothetical protein F2B00_03595 [Streptomyces parvus]|uniref:hypothetical protein n=1 Tax=Streptomyces parvus TaxID=66428 RepID=UPI00123BB97B|nr:hypothetical protein [Streptomyces parvus]KAA6203715.1 hypothetical protein F2B00_03595 [Streptomyces parvus]GGS41573.1 hypothetical protein GCM10010221_45510 [Streptomyces parvus]